MLISLILIQYNLKIYSIATTRLSRFSSKPFLALKLLPYSVILSGFVFSHTNRFRTTQVLNSSSTTTSSRVAKKTSSQRLITASSSTSSQSSQSQLSTTTSGSAVNPHALQRDLNEFKNSMSEINNLASRSNQMAELQKR